MVVSSSSSLRLTAFCLSLLLLALAVASEGKAVSLEAVGNPFALSSSRRSKLRPSSSIPKLVELRGGDLSDELADEAVEWCNNLGAPAALIAGAVIATIYETMHTGDLEVQERDAGLTKFGKKLTRLLLLSAFALEVISIFVTTVTGTMLKSRTVKFDTTSLNSPLAFLRENFEFEYLTARICFLQGLLNWIAAIGLGHAIPTDESPETRKLNKFVASFLFTTVLLIVSFYNNHLTFYSNYPEMLVRWVVVMLKDHLLALRPLSLLIVPSVAVTCYMGWVALFSGTDARAKGT